MKKKYIAELIGTFGLTLVVIDSASKDLGLLIPFFAAITLGLFVYTMGRSSGAYLNPAITVGAWVIKRIETIDAVMYIIAQMAGAALAVIVSQLFKVVVATPPATALNGWLIGGAEAIGMFFFAFGVAAVILGKVKDSMYGIVVGGSLFIGLILASTLGSLGILNLGVAFGLHSFTITYVVAGLVGAIAGMWVYKVLFDMV